MQKLLFPAFIAAVAFLQTASGAPIVFQDGNFTTWGGGTSYSTGGGSAGATKPASGGNPGRYFRPTVTISGNSSFTESVWFIDLFGNGLGSVTPSAIGGVDHLRLSYDILAAGEITAGVLTGLMVQQGLQFYLHPTPLADSSTWFARSWDSLRSEDFVHFLTSGAGIDANAHPDFSASGLPLSFGLYMRFSLPPRSLYTTVAAGFDNFRVEVIPVPEPGATTMCGVLLSLAALRRRKYTRGVVNTSAISPQQQPAALQTR